MSFSRPFTGLMPPLALLGLTAAAMLFDPFGAASALRGRLFDAWQVHAPADSSVELVILDSGSLARYGRWPWPNDGLRDLTRAAAGATVLVFATPLDRPESDSFPAPLQPVHAVAPLLLGVGGLEARPSAKFQYRGKQSPFGVTPLFLEAAGPNTAIARAAEGLGAPNLIAEADGVVRRMPLVFRLNRQLVPSLASEAVRLSAGQDTLIFGGDEGDIFTPFWQGAGLANMELKDRTIATGRDGSFWMDFGKAPQRISVATLLSNELGADALKGKILVLDTPQDLLRTPRGMESRGAVIALGIQNLLSGAVLARPLYVPLAELGALLLAGAFSLFLMARTRFYWAGLFVAAVLAGGFYLSLWAFRDRQILVDAATPGLGLSFALLAGILIRWIEVARARAALRMAFADSLPRASVERIAHSPSLLSVHGENRTVTYLVCGVRGLAELAASLRDNPKAFTEIMQLVMTPLMDQALAHGGTIDRLTADGFAAFWNAPLDDPDHALHACEAANGMSVMASRLNERLGQERPGLMPLEIGVGVASGPVIAGGFGGAGRMGYSVTGGVVQLAAQIQALSPQYGPAVIVAEETQSQAGREFAFLEVDYIASGAADLPVRLFALLGSPVVRASPKFRAMITFHDHIFTSLRRQQWAKARALIGQCRALSGASQQLYDLHLTRIGYFESNPPGPEWDGAFRPILK